MIQGATKKTLTAICFFLFQGLFSQPAAAKDATVTIDANMGDRIRVEEYRNSQISRFAGPLLDEIGPRLTGSPALTEAQSWAVRQLQSMGLQNVILEPWGEFGLSWTQGPISLTLIHPSIEQISAQIAPWSPPTQGDIHNAEVVYVPTLRNEADLAAWRGKLKGKLVLYDLDGPPKPFNPDKLPAFVTYSAAELVAMQTMPADGNLTPQHLFPPPGPVEMTTAAFRPKVDQFLHEEGVAGVLVAGGSGGILRDDNSLTFGRQTYRLEHRQFVPEAIIASEGWFRMYRLIERRVPVRADLSIQATFGDTHALGKNLTAELPGSDPKMGDQVVMIGAHLDSWTAATGASDDGAGALIAIEAMRILSAVHAKPRRTIRLALWSGEEQGELGSEAYVKKHFGPAGPMKAAAGAKQPTPQKELAAYFNLDSGDGHIVGVYTAENQEAAAILRKWIEPLNALGVTMVSERPAGSTDNVSFLKAGLPGFEFAQEPRDSDSRLHHTVLDTYGHLSLPELEQAAVVEAIIAYDAAMDETPLPSGRWQAR